MRKSSPAALGLAAAVVCLTGCSAGAARPDEERVDAMRLLVSPTVPQGAAGVGFEGRVTIDSGGCLAVGGAALVALPGSRLNGDGSFTLADPGGGVDAVTLRVGERFRLGGTVAEPTDRWAQPYLPDEADSCGSTRFLLVFGG
jgi:hypothetical protein